MTWCLKPPDLKLASPAHRATSMNQPRAASAAVASPHVARSTAGPPDVGGGGADIGANAATGKSASTACTVGARAGAGASTVSGGQYLFLCFLGPARLAGAGAGAHGIGAGDIGAIACRLCFACAGGGGGSGSGGGELGVVGAGRSATSTAIFMPPWQCPGAPQMK